jgi:ComF family protein
MLGGRVIKYLKDCLFPVFCIDCHQEGQWWCENCLVKKEFGVFYCPVCHRKNTNGHPCNQCRAATPLNGVAAFLNYEEHSAIAELIRQFKYQFAYDINDVWEKIINLYLNKIILQMDIKSSAPIIIPVPLHQKRQRERGFNQADLIGRLVFEHLQKSWPVGFNNVNLQRKKPTKQQAKLNRLDRIKNLEGVFAWNESIPGKSIILVDDVYTSGTTLNECALVLKQAGAQKVFGLTLARD